MSEFCALVEDDFFSKFVRFKDVGKGSYGELYLILPNNPKYVVKEQPIITKGSEQGITKSSLFEVDTLVKLKPFDEVIEIIGACYGKTALRIILEAMDFDLYKYYRTLSIDERISLVRQLLKTLIRAASILEHLNITHFDIKPTNVLVKKEPSVKFVITDFGISRISFARHHLEMFEVFTLWYRPPEFLAERERISFQPFKGDIWAIAVTIVEFILGDFFIAERTTVEMLQRIWELSDQTVSEKDFHKANKEGTITGTIDVGAYLSHEIGDAPFRKIDPEIIQTLTKMLSLNPDDRPSAEEILSSLFKEELDPNLFDLVPVPVVPKRRIKGRLLSTIFRLSRNLRFEVSTMVIALEILTRYLGLYERVTPEIVHAVAALRLASLYNENYITETEDFAHFFPSIDQEDIVKAEREILDGISFHVYNIKLTPLILRLYDEKIDVRGIPPERFARPLEKWF